MRKKIPTKLKLGFSPHFCRDHTNKEKITLEQVNDYLRDNNLKITKFRSELIQLLLECNQHNMSIGLIIAKLKKNNKNVNISSIYNNIYALSKIGVLRGNIDIPSAELTYEIALQTAPHMHVYDIDKDLQMIWDVNCDIHDAMVKVCAEKGYILEDYLIQATVHKKAHFVNAQEDKELNQDSNRDKN